MIYQIGRYQIILLKGNKIKDLLAETRENVGHVSADSYDEVLSKLGLIEFYDTENGKLILDRRAGNLWNEIRHNIVHHGAIFGFIIGSPSKELSLKNIDPFPDLPYSGQKF